MSWVSKLGKADQAGFRMFKCIMTGAAIGLVGREIYVRTIWVRLKISSAFNNRACVTSLFTFDLFVLKPLYLLFVSNINWLLLCYSMLFISEPKSGRY